MFLVYLGIDELEEIFPFVHNFFSFFLIPDFCNVFGHLVVYLGINELQDIFRFFHNLFLRSQISAAMSQG